MNKEFKSFIKVPGGSEAQFCHYPFKIDTYGKGCGHNCLYCYAKSVLDFRKLWDSEDPAQTDINKIKKIFEDVFDKNKKNNKYYDVLTSKIPVRLGGMTDCFTPSEEQHGITYEFIKLLNHYNYPHLILTKNDLISKDKYLNILNKDLAYIQFSITTPYDDISLTFEEGASKTSDRLKAIQKISNEGFYTAARINPLFPIYKDGYFTGKHNDDKKFRYFDWSLIDMMADSKVDTVIAGFLRLSSWNIKWIQNKTGENLTWLFDESTKQKNQALHFSTEEKRYYYEKIKNMCDDKGMAFSVCYDGDEDYETFRYLWANQDDCCNGLHNVKEFKNTYQYINYLEQNKK